MHNNNSASGIGTIDSGIVSNLLRYGFEKVEILPPSEDGKVFCSVGPDGRIDGKFLRASATQLERLSRHLNPIQRSQ